MALFGSILRDDFGPHSDIDLLVDFEPGHTPGLALIRMQDERSILFGNRKVDLITLKFLHPRIREHWIVHDYMNVDEDMVWQMVIEDLSSLIKQLEEITPVKS